MKNEKKRAFLLNLIGLTVDECIQQRAVITELIANTQETAGITSCIRLRCAVDAIGVLLHGDSYVAAIKAGLR